VKQCRCYERLKLEDDVEASHMEVSLNTKAIVTFLFQDKTGVSRANPLLVSCIPNTREKERKKQVVKYRAHKYL
jgi:hypothetical protein